MNIRTVSNLKEYVCSYGLPKVKVRGLVRVYENVLKALSGKPTPLVKYHRRSENPYFYRYGETWVDNLNNYSFVSKLCCISYLLIFILKEGEKILRESVH